VFLVPSTNSALNFATWASHRRVDVLKFETRLPLETKANVVPPSVSIDKQFLSSGEDLSIQLLILITVDPTQFGIYP
jgi:hypothetical protein